MQPSEGLSRYFQHASCSFLKSVTLLRNREKWLLFITEEKALLESITQTLQSSWREQCWKDKNTDSNGENTMGKTKDKHWCFLEQVCRTSTLSLGPWHQRGDAADKEVWSTWKDGCTTNKTKRQTTKNNLKGTRLCDQEGSLLAFEINRISFSFIIPKTCQG